MSTKKLAWMNNISATLYLISVIELAYFTIDGTVKVSKPYKFQLVFIAAEIIMSFPQNLRPPMPVVNNIFLYFNRTQRSRALKYHLCSVRLHRRSATPRFVSHFQQRCQTFSHI